MPYDASDVPYKRSTSRVHANEDVWVCWRCDGHDAISRVRDISVGGLSLEVSNRRAAVGQTATLDFLVQEGPIRVECVVRRVEIGHRLGFKFTAVTDAHRSHLAKLISRLRGYPLRP